MTDSIADVQSLASSIAGWLGDRLAEAGAERFVLGLSGGIDSAVVCALCARAAGPDAVLAAVMPSHSNPLDAEHARLVATTFCVEAVQIDLTAVADAFFAAVARVGTDGTAVVDAAAPRERERLATANIKPRLRMTTLYYLANLHNGVVVGTGNKTEARLGYFTKYGDGGVDVLPIVDLYKHEVRALAGELGVPEPVIAKAPSAGLWPGQTDEAELGASYDDLDAALVAIERGEPRGDAGLLDRVARLERATAHKRAPIPAFRRERSGGGE